MKTRMEAFATARFATHPDGRIAARVDPNDGLPWIAQMPRVGRAYRSDEDMARDGWSPLDETRLPRVVTDEKVRAVAEAMWMHSEEPGTFDEASEDWLKLAWVALSAAPTADKDAHDARTYALEQIEAAQAETTEAVARAEKAERERDGWERLYAEVAVAEVERTATLTAREYLEAAIALMDAKR